MTARATRSPRAAQGPGRVVEWVEAASGAARRDACVEFLRGCDRQAPALLLGPSPEAAGAPLRQVAAGAAVLGWHRHTLVGLAHSLAMPRLAAEGRVPLTGLGRHALVARVAFELGARERLGRYQPLYRRPGLAPALGDTLDELRQSGVAPDALPVWLLDLAEVYRAYCAALSAHRVADRVEVLQLAADAARAGAADPRVGAPLLVLEPASTRVDEGQAAAALLAALVAASSRARIVTAPAALGAEGLRQALAAAGVGLAERRLAAQGPLRALQETLFRPDEARGDAPPAPLTVFSAPGESRECVELARQIHAAARDGVRFEQIAIALRAPGLYRGPLAEALRRADIPAVFESGVPAPNPTGRAFLALLACRAEDLSARRMAEFLSLGEARSPVAPAEDGAALPAGDPALGRLDAGAAAETRARPGWLDRPRQWEALLNDAKVIGSEARWRRRLAALEQEYRRAARALDADEPRAVKLAQDAAEVGALSAYVLPIVERLAALPEAASWGEWLAALDALAAATLEAPEPVRATLAELSPMAPIGPVTLEEVQLVLGPRLAAVQRPAARPPQGAVTVASMDDLAGRVFDWVFIPGLAERLFPQKVAEDALLLDGDRAGLSQALRTNRQRVAEERHPLRVAVQAATQRVVISYPRLDLGAARPRVPSFYALEVVRAARGRLPSFEELRAESEQTVSARLGWPAPADPADAIDAAEFDLAQLADVRFRPEQDVHGRLRYALEVNRSLARALRARYARWAVRRWSPYDGFRLPPDALSPLRRAAARALVPEGMDQRPFSATALQSYAACPYRFYLYALARLAPREVPVPLEELDPLQRGSLVHDIQFETLSALRDEGLLPMDGERLASALGVLEAVADRVVERTRDQLFPALERVFDDNVALIRSDLREWLRRLAADRAWVPWRFELAFGLIHGDGRDPHSQDAPVLLDNGLRLRGAIDLVESSRALRTAGVPPALRATDSKSGRVSVRSGAVIAGGTSLQPVLYALALEKLIPDRKSVV